jgi:hypothetical protein
MQRSKKHGGNTKRKIAVRLMRLRVKKRVYPAQSLPLKDVFEPDQTEYLHLYLLVVRALRLCDQRSVQLEK